MRARAPIVLAAVVVAGCAIESAGLAGGPETGASPDAGTASADAGARPDAAGFDAARDADGVDGGDVPSDAGHTTDGGTVECDDGVTSCSPDGTEVVGCVDGRMTRLACPAGCDPATTDCRPVSMCGLGFHGDLVAGVDERFTLCGEGNDVGVRWTTECQGGADGEDRVYRIVLDRRRMVRLDLRDNDGANAIDTVLHVRSDCDDTDSQVACEDDIPCDEADPDFGCSGGTELRQSIIEMELGPGTYFVAADSINQGTWRCGEVLLRYSWP